MIEFENLENGHVYVSGNLGGSKKDKIYVLIDSIEGEYDGEYEEILSTFLTITADLKECTMNESDTISASDTPKFKRKATSGEIIWFNECYKNGGYLDNPDLRSRLLSEFSYLLKNKYVKTY